MSFIARQPVIEKEVYPWRGEMPGQVRIPVAARCWVWQTAGFEPRFSGLKFSGFIEELLDALTGERRPISDLRPLMPLGSGVDFLKAIPDRSTPFFETFSFGIRGFSYFAGLGGSSLPTVIHSGATCSTLGGISASTFRKVHDNPPSRIDWNSGLSQTSSRWPIEV